MLLKYIDPCIIIIVSLSGWQVGQEIEVRPGIVSKTSDGKIQCTPIRSRIVSLFAEHNELQYAVPGGLIGVYMHVTLTNGTGWSFTPRDMSFTCYAHAMPTNMHQLAWVELYSHPHACDMSCTCYPLTNMHMGGALLPLSLFRCGNQD